MAIKLTPNKPDDRYVRMYYALETKGDETSFWYEAKIVPEAQANDNTGWIEYWAPDAKACKNELKRINGRLYILQERREKRKEELTDEAAIKELEEFEALIGEGLAYRTKAWSLVDSDGGSIEAPLTFDNAKSVYADDSHDLREKTQTFLKDRKNFPLRASGS